MLSFKNRMPNGRPPVSASTAIRKPEVLVAPEAVQLFCTAVLAESKMRVVNTTEPPLLTLRGSMQCTDPKTGATGYYPIRVVVRGKAKTTTLGKVAKGKKMESEVELEILYIKVEINNAVVLELDKLNFVFVLNGKDMLAQIRSQC